jgi:hypothetical protein
MTIDVTGGIEPAVDEMRTEPPRSPTFREGVAMFVWDDAGRFGIPRAMAEAVGATWKTSRVGMLYLAQPDGRLLKYREDAPPVSVFDHHGRPRVLGGGSMRFECVEPFVRWRLTFDGTAGEISPQDEPIPDDRVPVALTVDARMTAPPWVQGTHEPVGFFNRGEHRFEQLFDASGTLVLDGFETPFRGGGLRVHRTGGTRGTGEDFYGHVWQSARFPSGRAFGFMHYHPRPDGSERYCEGWLLDGREIMPAQVVERRWMTRMRQAGEDVSLTLRTRRGDVHIEAETYMSWFRPERARTESAASFPALQSGIVKYRWAGEEAFGMIERSQIR